MQGPSLGAPSSFRGVGRIGASEGQGGQGFEGWVGTAGFGCLLWLIPVIRFMTSLYILGDYVPNVFCYPVFLSIDEVIMTML